MNNREQRRLLEEELSKSIVTKEIWQDRPFTAVSLTVKHNGFTHNRIRGWAKCRWPDKWDPEYGIELATKKAISRLAKLLMRNDTVFFSKLKYTSTTGNVAVIDTTTGMG